MSQVLEMYERLIYSHPFLHPERKKALVETAEAVLTLVKWGTFPAQYRNLTEIWLLTGNGGPFVFESPISSLLPKELVMRESAVITQWHQLGDDVIARLTVKGFNFFPGSTDPNIYNCDYIIWIHEGEVYLPFVSTTYDDGDLTFAAPFVVAGINRPAVYVQVYDYVRERVDVLPLTFQ